MHFPPSGFEEKKIIFYLGADMMNDEWNKL